jgi:signal transduction histidine kinase
MEDMFTHNLNEANIIRCHKKSGEEIFVEAIGTRINYGGKAAGLASFRDMTHFKRTELELQKSQERLRSLTGYLQKVREDERTALSRVIHDDLGQYLTALNMDLSWLQDRLPDHNEMISNKMKGMSGLIEMAMKTVKKLSSDLRPSVLDDLGILAGIKWLVEEFKRHSGIECFLELQSDIVMGKEHSTTVYRILQEILTNVVRHAEATQVTIILKKANGNVEMSVRDNGKGITKDQISASDSFGIIGIRERAQNFGGKVEIIGIPDGGTILTVIIPLNEERNNGSNINC